MTNTTRTLLLDSDYVEDVLRLELGFSEESGVGGLMGWWVSPDGCTRFYWEDADACAFVLARFADDTRSSLRAKLTLAGVFSADVLRAVVAGFVG